MNKKMGILNRIKGYKAKREKEKIRKHNVEISVMENEIKILNNKLKQKQMKEARKSERNKLKKKIHDLEIQVSRRKKFVDDAKKELVSIGKKAGLGVKQLGGELSKEIKSYGKPRASSAKKKASKKVKSFIDEIIEGFKSE